MENTRISHGPINETSLHLKVTCATKKEPVRIFRIRFPFPNRNKLERLFRYTEKPELLIKIRKQFFSDTKGIKGHTIGDHDIIRLVSTIMFESIPN